MLLLGTDVHAKTIGIVGFGRIGYAVAQRAKGTHHSSSSHSFVSTLFSDLSRFLRENQRNVVYHLNLIYLYMIQFVRIVVIFLQLKIC